MALEPRTPVLLRDPKRLRRERFGGLYMDLPRSLFLIFNETGYLILREASGGATPEEIAAALAARFPEEDRDLLLSSVLHFLNQAAAAGLVVPAGSSAGPGVDRPAPDLRERAPGEGGPSEYAKAILDPPYVLGVEPNVLSAPLKVLIEVTRRCNLRCVHCYARSGDSNSEEMETSEMKALLDDLVDAGVHYFVVSGGEPLVRRDLFEILEHISKLGAEASLLTNATLIDREKAARLRELGVLKVEANLDSARPEVYDRFRGVAGAFEMTVRGVRALVEEGVPTRLNVTVTRMNFGELEDIVEAAAELGVKEVAFVELKPSGRGLDNYSELALTPEERANVGRRIRELAARYRGRVLVLGGSREDLDMVDPHGVLPLCGAGKLHCSVTPWGDVKPCAFLPDDPACVAGNVREKSVREIWLNSPIFADFRRLGNPVCEACGDARCAGGCRVRVYAETGSLSGAPDPKCSRAPRAG